MKLSKKTQSNSCSPRIDFIDQYEILRDQMINQVRSGHTHGEALFLKRGMISWLETCHRSLPPNSPKGTLIENNVLPCGQHGEIAGILANMLLNSETGSSTNAS